MSLDIEDLAEKMCSAALPIVLNSAPQIGNYVATECTKLAHTIALLEQEQEDGRITESQAHILIEMQKNGMRSVLTSAEGLSAIVAQDAINAALAAIRDIVNAALKLPIL